MFESVTATIFITNMDRAVEFYTKTLGLPLSARYGDFWAGIDLGKGAAIGLHPAKKPPTPAPGTNGSTQVGLVLSKPIDAAVAELTAKGVKFKGPVVDDGAVKIAFFDDPDGNELYICEVKKWS